MNRVGDMDAEEFRREAHRVVDWIADYLAHPERYRVLSAVGPGDIRDALPAHAPEQGESFERLFADFERTIVPGLTHWNHPGFFAYFGTSASGPGILAEALAAGLNVQAMLWRTSPAATELEDVALAWLGRLIGLPTEYGGVIYDTASVSTVHALACARAESVAQIRHRGLYGAPPLRVYFSEDAHSSVDKAVVLLGIGLDGARRIPVDSRHAMRVDALERAILEDVSAGNKPSAVVATIGTTSSTAVDPVASVAALCQRYGIWLHVDAAYAGVAAMLPQRRDLFAGIEVADSIVVNPHKWLFTPFDLSVLFCRRMDALRDTFSLVAEYLRTPESSRVRNLMDTGIQLGRRFRALKLWMVLRYFGAEGIRTRLAEHMRLARLFAAWVDADAEFERLADVPFSVVCFRYRPSHLSGAELDAANEDLLERVNASGEVFLSHTKLDGKFTLRLAVCQIRTTEFHVARAWELLRREAASATVAR